jgi:hypothetical protein
MVGAMFTIPAFPQSGIPGSGATVNVGPSVSMRLIADTSDWDKTQNGIPLGQSAFRNSPLERSAGRLAQRDAKALPFSKAAVEAATKDTLVMTPVK